MSTAESGRNGFDARAVDDRRTEREIHRAIHRGVSPSGEPGRFLQQEDLIAAALEGHDVRLEQVEHRSPIEPVRADALRELHLHEEVLAEPIARHGDPDLVVLLVGIEEARANFRAPRHLGERPRSGALLRRALRGGVRCGAWGLRCGRNLGGERARESQEQADGSKHESILAGGGALGRVASMIGPVDESRKRYWFGPRRRETLPERADQ